MRDDPGRPRGSLLRRLAWLLACVVAGAVVGFIGQRITGNPAWWLAIPAVLAVGWLFNADPTQCEPRRRDRDEHDPKQP